MKKQVVALASLALTGAAFATEFMWKAAVDGEISDPNMWNQAASPETGDSLVWGTSPNPYGNTPFTVYLDADRSYASASPRTGQVTFDLRGHSLSLVNWTALTYRNWATAGIWAGTTISNGTLNVTDLFQPNYPAPDHVGTVRIAEANTVVNAKKFYFGGMDATLTVSDGAKINTQDAANCQDQLLTGKAGRNTVTFTGQGTEYNMKGGLQLGNNAYTAGQGYEGLNALVIEKGATFNADGYIQVGWNSNGQNPTEIRIQDGGVMYKNGFLNIGTWSSDSRVIVTGEHSFASITNGAIYICDQSTTNCQLVVSDHAKFEFHTCMNGDNDINVNGCGGARLIVEDGAEFTIHNHYNGAGDVPGPYQEVRVGNRKTSTAKDAKIIVRNGATWKVVGRSTMYLGDGDFGAELVVSNATFDAGTTDSDLKMAVGEGYAFTEDTQTTLRLQGDDVLAKFFTIRLGFAPHIILEPGANGFNQTPLQLTKNVYWKTDGYVPSPEEEPELVLDVTNWKPMHSGEKTLIQTDRNAYRWDYGTNAMKRLVANARVIPADRADKFRIFLTDNLDAVKVAYKSHAGLLMILR